MQRKAGCVKTEADIGVMRPQARNGQGPQKLEEVRKESLRSLRREHGPAQTLVWIPASRTVKINFCCLKLPGCGRHGSPRKRIQANTGAHTHAAFRNTTMLQTRAQLDDDKPRVTLPAQSGAETTSRLGTDPGIPGCRGSRLWGKEAAWAVDGSVWDQAAGAVTPSPSHSPTPSSSHSLPLLWLSMVPTLSPFSSHLACHLLLCLETESSSCLAPRLSTRAALSAARPGPPLLLCCGERGGSFITYRHLP